MKYEIKEVLPAQLKVEFEDGSWALVPIRPEATLEEIDHAVSQYDPDFLPDPQTLINPNVSVGEQRESKTLETISPENLVPVEYNDLQTVVSAISPINLTLSNYFEAQGDTRIKEALESKVVEYLEKTNLTVEKVLDDINLIP